MITNVKDVRFRNFGANEHRAKLNEESPKFQNGSKRHDQSKTGLIIFRDAAAGCYTVLDVIVHRSAEDIL